MDLPFTNLHDLIVSDLFFIKTEALLDEAIFLQTNRGGRKLVHDGFSFTVNRKLNNGLISWKCRKYKQCGCHARAVTKMIKGQEYVKLSKPEHTHPSDTKSF